MTRKLLPFPGAESVLDPLTLESEMRIAALRAADARPPQPTESWDPVADKLALYTDPPRRRSPLSAITVESFAASIRQAAQQLRRIPSVAARARAADTVPALISPAGARLLQLLGGSGRIVALYSADPLSAPRPERSGAELAGPIRAAVVRTDGELPRHPGRQQSHGAARRIGRIPGRTDEPEHHRSGGVGIAAGGPAARRQQRGRAAGSAAWHRHRPGPGDRLGTGAWCHTRGARRQRVVADRRIDAGELQHWIEYASGDRAQQPAGVRVDL